MTGHAKGRGHTYQGEKLGLGPEQGKKSQEDLM